MASPETAGVQPEAGDLLAALRRRLRHFVVPLAAVLGVLLGVAVAPPVIADVGPFTVSAVARPALASDTVVRLAPLGSITLDTHWGPLAFALRLEELRPEEAQAIADDPGSLEELGDGLAGDVRSVLLQASRRAVLAGLAGGLLLAYVARRRTRSMLTGAIVATVLLGASGVAAATTFDPTAVNEPRYSGLLALAPTAVGDVNDVIDRFGEYRLQLTDLVSNAVVLYRAGRDLPDLDPGLDVIRLLHISDIHNNPQAFDLIAQLVDDFAINAVVDTGDISDWGSGAETQLTEPIADLKVPYVFVRGNHDSPATEAAIAALPNAVVLDGDDTTVAGLRIWGIGDPRFTPDKDQETGVGVERRQIADFAPRVRSRLLLDRPSTVDLVMIHDHRGASDLEGLVPLVLSGHFHEPREEGDGKTRFLLEGSTGGAGLRALQGEFPEPLTATVLYFDRSERRLAAYDRIRVSGLGESGASIERTVIPADRPDREGPKPPASERSAASGWLRSARVELLD